MTVIMCIYTIRSTHSMVIITCAQQSYFPIKTFRLAFPSFRVSEIVFRFECDRDSTLIIVTIIRSLTDIILAKFRNLCKNYKRESLQKV